MVSRRVFKQFNKRGFHFICTHFPSLCGIFFIFNKKVLSCLMYSYVYIFAHILYVDILIDKEYWIQYTNKVNNIPRVSLGVLRYRIKAVIMWRDGCLDVLSLFCTDL